MKYRIFDITAYIAIAIVGFLVILEAGRLPEGFGGEVSSGSFPRALGYLIIAFCGIGIVSSFFKSIKEISFPNTGRLIVSLVMMSAFVLSWSIFGYFYIQLAIFLFVILAYYRAPAGLSSRVLKQNFAVSFSIAMLFYVVFTHVMYLKM